MSNFEKKFGKYAIKNISLFLVLCYAIGFVIEQLAPTFVYYLTLDAYQILRGQVWRLVTWLLVPPSSYNFFTLAIMMLFYYSIGSSLERTWGTYRYNVYLLSGMAFTTIGCFLVMGITYMFWNVFYPTAPDFLSYSENAAAWFLSNSIIFSTIYVNLSIFLAFAVTFPNHQVLLMFLIPVKVKWMGIAYGVMLGIEFITVNTGDAISNLAYRITMVASLLNFFIFWLRSGKRVRISPKQMIKRQSFQRDARPKTFIAHHKCAICGRSEEEDPELEFRFCSKCNGNYEYCQQHLFSHEHVK